MPKSIAVLSLVLALFSGQLLAKDPLTVAHRGLLRFAPENTLANFRACLELRLGFEFDVQQTKDGRLVCIHDATVDRTTNGSGRVDAMTLDQIRKLDAGAWFDKKFAGQRVPTLDEVLALIGKYRQHDVLIAVDLKKSSVAAEVARRARKLGLLSKLLFIGRPIASPQLRSVIRRAAPRALTAALANTPAEFAQAMAAGTPWVYLRFLPTKSQMTAVHRTNKRAFIAGVTVAGRLPDNWRRAARAGMDAILTDYPLSLRVALRDRAK